jgi:hypothetical protein
MWNRIHVFLNYRWTAGWAGMENTQTTAISEHPFRVKAGVRKRASRMNGGANRRGALRIGHCSGCVYAHGNTDRASRHTPMPCDLALRVDRYWITCPPFVDDSLSIVSTLEERGG